ncbi:hypothetical protein [Brucella sp. LJL56]
MLMEIIVKLIRFDNGDFRHDSIAFFRETGIHVFAQPEHPSQTENSWQAGDIAALHRLHSCNGILRTGANGLHHHAIAEFADRRSG